MSNELPLAAEFPPTSDAEWRKLVEAALKGASFDKRLVSQTYDGLRIEPLYPRAAGAKPVAGRAPGQAWTLMQRVDHPDPAAANAQALEDLENGATGLTLVIAGSLDANGYGLDADSPITLDRVLDGIELEPASHRFQSRARRRAMPVRALRRVGEEAARSIPATVDLRASIDPIGDFAASGASAAAVGRICRALRRRHRRSELAAKASAAASLRADGRIIHKAGGSEAQELAFAIAARGRVSARAGSRRRAARAARGMIYFRLAADADEFLTIAKFRAIRKLWARVEEACGLTPKPVYVAAETAWRMMTQRDPYVNMLRTTIAVTAAGLGGADSIVALPHTAALGLPDAFARRVARNTQLILLEESNLGRSPIRPPAPAPSRT